MLHAKNGDTIRTEWGVYRRSEPFHFAWSDYDMIRRRSNGGWYCNSCMKATDTEHDNPECHRCSDWSPCGNDCTLSRIICELRDDRGCGLADDVIGRPIGAGNPAHQTVARSFVWAVESTTWA